MDCESPTAKRRPEYLVYSQSSQRRQIFFKARQNLYMPFVIFMDIVMGIFYISMLFRKMNDKDYQKLHGDPDNAIDIKLLNTCVHPIFVIVTALLVFLTNYKKFWLEDYEGNVNPITRLLSQFLSDDDKVWRLNLLWFQTRLYFYYIALLWLVYNAMFGITIVKHIPIFRIIGAIGSSVSLIQGIFYFYCYTKEFSKLK